MQRGRICKVKYNQRCRRFRFVDIDYKQLRHHIEVLLFQDKPREFDIMYQDDGDDTCIISSQDEWEDALQCVGGLVRPFILTIEVKKGEQIPRFVFNTPSSSSVYVPLPKPVEPTPLEVPLLLPIPRSSSPPIPIDVPLPKPVPFPTPVNSNDGGGIKFDIGVWNGGSLSKNTFLMDESFPNVATNVPDYPTSDEAYFQVQMWEEHKLLTRAQMDRLCSFLDFVGGSVKGDFQVQFKDRQALDMLLDTTNPNSNCSIGDMTSNPNCSIGDVTLNSNYLMDDVTSNMGNVDQLYAESSLKDPKLVLRRTSGPTEGCIDFHTDVSESTVQITLNGDDEYVGGKLCYLTSNKVLVTPTRPRGTMTKHNKYIYHGVSKLFSGVRYSLFLIDKPSSVAMDATMDHVVTFLST